MKKLPIILCLIISILSTVVVVGCSNNSSSGYLDEHTGEGEYDYEIIHWLLQGKYYQSGNTSCIWANFSDSMSVYESYSFFENGTYRYVRKNYNIEQIIDEKEGRWSVSNNKLHMINSNNQEVEYKLNNEAFSYERLEEIIEKDRDEYGELPYDYDEIKILTDHLNISEFYVGDYSDYYSWRLVFEHQDYIFFDDYEDLEDYYNRKERREAAGYDWPGYRPFG